MFVIRIAQLNIAINNRNDFVKRLCRDYIVETDAVDFTAEATADEIAAEQAANTESFSDGYIEGICIYRKICMKLPEYDGFLFHSSVVEVDGSAYAFSAKSGVGKSTHTMLWKKLLGEKLTIINGDKPIYRYIDGTLYAFGTPWSGKERFDTNTFAPLKAICFISRAQENAIRRISEKEAMAKSLHQLILPKNDVLLDKTFALLGRALVDTPVYEIECNISVDAARLAYETMR